MSNLVADPPQNSRNTSQTRKLQARASGHTVSCRMSGVTLPYTVTSAMRKSRPARAEPFRPRTGVGLTPDSADSIAALLKHAATTFMPWDKKKHYST